MDGDTEAQLAILATITERFAAQRMRFWLRGGWAVEFLLGEVTRRHGDIDLVTWSRHRRRVHRTLIDAGFELIREWEAQTDFRARDQTISIVYLTRLPDGKVITHGIPVWTWPDGRVHTLDARYHDTVPNQGMSAPTIPSWTRPESRSRRRRSS